MKTKCPPSNFGVNQQSDSPDELVADPYQLHDRHPEPAACPDCGAVYLHGCWRWMAAPANASAIQCPACRRSRDKLAAGYVSIEGEFTHEHRAHIQRLIERLAARKKCKYPLQRIMSIEEFSDGLLISTTDVQLAQAIGETLREIYRGNLDFHYSEAEYLLRVRWQPWM